MSILNFFDIANSFGIHKYNLDGLPQAFAGEAFLDFWSLLDKGAIAIAVAILGTVKDIKK